jgi:hypothetical protein
MRRWLSIPVALLALSMFVGPVLAAPGPARIDLPSGWRPEGITAGRGLTAYVGSLADGGIARVNLLTGAVDPDFVASAGGMAVGIDYEAGADRLWVAGGTTGEVRVYDASSGALLQTYTFAAGFINDIAVTSSGAYATDSFIPQVLVVPLGPGGALPDPADASSVDLQSPFEYVAGFNANGIVAFAGWLLIPNSTTGQLFAVSPADGRSVELLPAGSVGFADGLEMVGSTLYVVRNQLNQVDIYRLHGGALVSLGSITNDEVGNALDVPTTAAFAGGALWAVNARFNTPPDATTAYWITRLPLR